ncbi:MAG: hypothetical protein GX442_05490 [Candidatus Riflebacteria bacterium]|nr:hypothetical protein [Candidatus Riflebacteria bacterium]
MAVLLGALLAGAIWWRPLPAARVFPAGISCFQASDQFRGLAITGPHLWAGGRDRLLLVDWRQNLELPLPTGTPALSHVEDMATDASGAVWVAHDFGLHVLEPGGGWRDLTSLLPDPKALAVFPTASGEVWVGTWNGTGCFRQGVWHPFAHPEKLAHPMVRTILADSAGGWWFGSNAAPDGGLAWFDGTTWQTFSVENGLPHNNVVAMAEDREGAVWVGTGFFDRGGLTRFGPPVAGKRPVRHFSKADGLAGEKCRSVFQDRDGIWWFGSEFSGLARFDGKDWRRFTEADGLCGNEIMVMRQDPDGHLWLGTNHGLARLASPVVRLWQGPAPNQGY